MSRPRTHPRFPLVIFASLVLVAATVCIALRAQTPAEADTVVVSRHVMVRMRDGVRLATDVYLPARAGTALPLCDARLDRSR